MVHFKQNYTPEEYTAMMKEGLERIRRIKGGKNEDDNPLDSLEEDAPPPPPLLLDDEAVDPKTGMSLYKLRLIVQEKDEFVEVMLDMLESHLIIPREEAQTGSFNVIREQVTPRRNLSKLSDPAAIRREMSAIYRECYLHGSDGAPYYTKLMYMLDCVARAMQMEMAADRRQLKLKDEDSDRPTEPRAD